MAGVVSTVVGYTGGVAEWPTYKKIGDHTEALMVEFNPSEISYVEILGKFFKQHDPWEGGRCRGGSNQYMIGLWFHDEEQKNAIDSLVARLERDRPGAKVQTHIAPLGSFYRAEEYHQRFYEKQQRGRF